MQNKADKFPVFIFKARVAKSTQRDEKQANKYIIK